MILLEHWKLTTQWLKKYDGLAQIWIFHRPTVLISRSDVVEVSQKRLLFEKMVFSCFYESVMVSEKFKTNV